MIGFSFSASRNRFRSARLFSYFFSIVSALYWLGMCGIGLRIELLVVQAVQDAAEFIMVRVQRRFEAVRLSAILGLPRVPRRNGRDKIRVNNPAFHQVDRMGIVVVAQPVVVHEILRPVQARGAQHMLAGHALMLEVVQGEAHPRMPHAEVLIHLVKQHRHQRRLPVVAMDDIRVLVGLEHELQRRAAKKGESQHVVVLPVKTPAVEKIVLGMRFDEKALAPVHEAETDAAVDRAAVPRHPQILRRISSDPKIWL